MGKVVKNQVRLRRGKNKKMQSKQEEASLRKGFKFTKFFG